MSPQPSSTSTTSIAVTTTPAPISSSNGVQISGALATVETIASDLFELGLGAVSVFVKNGKHLATAVNIANVLKTVFPFL